MSKKPIFTDVLQVGIVVKNIEESVRRYADEYGIEPWKIYYFDHNHVKNMVIKGEPKEYAMKVALANIGKVEIELIEPKDDKSIYAEFLKLHGEGMHHLAFKVENYDNTVDFFYKKGEKIFQGGEWNGETYSYFNTHQDLGFITEIYNRSPNFEEPEPIFIYSTKS